MTLDQLLDIWYQTDTDFFDEINALDSTTMADRARTQLYLALDEGYPLSESCDGVYTDIQANELKLLLGV